METTKTPKRNRTNAEILADMKAEKAAAPAKRKRRTNAEIARDKAKALEAEQAAAEAARQVFPIVTFHVTITLFGRMWNPGDEMRVTENSIFYPLTHDSKGKFTLNKTPELQKKLWGQVRYTVREEPVNGFDNS